MRGVSRFVHAVSDSHAQCVRLWCTHRLTLCRRDGDTWTSALSLASGLPGLVAAKEVTAGRSSSP